MQEIVGLSQDQVFGFYFYVFCYRIFFEGIRVTRSVKRYLDEYYVAEFKSNRDLSVLVYIFYVIRVVEGSEFFRVLVSLVYIIRFYIKILNKIKVNRVILEELKGDNIQILYIYILIFKNICVLIGSGGGGNMGDLCLNFFNIYNIILVMYSIYLWDDFIGFYV